MDVCAVAQLPSPPYLPSTLHRRVPCLFRILTCWATVCTGCIYSSPTGREKYLSPVFSMDSSRRGMRACAGHAAFMSAGTRMTAGDRLQNQCENGWVGGWVGQTLGSTEHGCNIPLFSLSQHFYYSLSACPIPTLQCVCLILPVLHYSCPVSI